MSSPCGVRECIPISAVGIGVLGAPFPFPFPFFPFPLPYGPSATTFLGSFTGRSVEDDEVGSMK